MSETLVATAFSFSPEIGEPRGNPPTIPSGPGREAVAHHSGRASSSRSAGRWSRPARPPITGSSKPTRSPGAPIRAEVLGCELAALATGRAFAEMLDADNFTTPLRHGDAQQAQGRRRRRSLPDRISVPPARPDRHARQYWLEDCGRWFAGADGRPAEAYRHHPAHRRPPSARPASELPRQLRSPDRHDESRPHGGSAGRGDHRVAERNAVSCAFAVAAINNLAVVNDAYGFEVADEVIIAVGRRLRQVMRTGDAMARYSGSKFGIILNNCDEEDLRTRRRALARRGARKRHRDGARAGLGDAVDRRRRLAAAMPTRPIPPWRAPKRR